MPELPEVETIKRDLEEKLIGLRINDVDVYDDRVIKDVSQRTFISKLKNRTFKSIFRRGKAIIIMFDNGQYLVIQVKMTGFLIYHSQNLKTSQNSKETKVVFQLSNGRYLNYNDQRLFGWLILTDDLSTLPYIKTLGPEPFDESLDVDWYKNKLQSRKMPIKPLLMNQAFLAGIGNIYASEILFRAQINPKKASRRLTSREIKSLHQATVETLKEAIAFRGTSMRNYRDSKGKKGKFMERIRVYGRENKGCINCGTSIKRIVQSGRSTYFCKRCQQ